MAKEIVIRLIDDRDKEIIETGFECSTQFAMPDEVGDLWLYEMDLRAANHAKFVAVNKEWVDCARKVKKLPRTGRGKGQRLTSAPEIDDDGKAKRKRANAKLQSSEWYQKKTQRPNIRAWAAEQGFTLNTGGRVPKHIEQAYDAAHNREGVLYETFGRAG